MRRGFCSLILLLFVISPAHANQITLNGLLETDESRAVPDTRVSVAGGQADQTDKKGKFSLKLSRDFIQGERVILLVDKKDWVINHPLDGEWNLPSLRDQNIHETMVIIVPKGSKKLWTHNRIEKLIAGLSDELAKAQKDGENPKPADFTSSLDGWAKQYGFTVTEVKEQFDQWAAKAEKAQDKRTRALAEFYWKNFVEAAKLFDMAAADDEVELAKMKEKVRLKILHAYENRKDAGNAYMSAYLFADALEQYLKAQQLIVKESFSKKWAEIQVLTGNVQIELGIRVEGEKGNAYMRDAVTAYRQAFEIYVLPDFQQDWAATQNNLGNVLLQQGIRSNGAEEVKLLRESVAAYRRALAVQTRERQPQDWAATQNNLGNALWQQGIRTSGAEGVKLLKEAEAAYRRAIEIYKFETLPKDWAMSQNNIGGALAEQGIRTDGAEGVKLLADAVSASKSALKVYTRETLPQNWAGTQNNLGAALVKLGSRTEGAKGVKLIGDAVAAFLSALEVRTRETLPQDWASTQNNLGSALQAQGIRIGDAEGARLLRYAEAAYRSALEVRTRKTLPQDWAMTQNNLGSVLHVQGKRTEGVDRAKLLGDAVTAYRNALEVRTRETLPQQWSITQNNLAIVYCAQGDWLNLAGCLEELTFYNKSEDLYIKTLSLYRDVLKDSAKSDELQRRWEHEKHKEKHKGSRLHYPFSEVCRPLCSSYPRRTAKRQGG